MTEKILKVGMYVRCPIDKDEMLDDVYAESRTYYLGQIMSVYDETTTIDVKFHDPFKVRELFTALPTIGKYNFEDVKRTPALKESKAFVKNDEVTIIHIKERPNGEKLFYTYYCEREEGSSNIVRAYREDEIIIPFMRADYNPANQMNNYELQSPMWYMKRIIVSRFMSVLANSPYGFKNLLGTRVLLFSHQVDTVVRALSEKPCRLMLADEVGLGKTIEALSIVKGLMDNKPSLKTLLVVPEPLLYQWYTEIKYKFWFEVDIYGNENQYYKNILLVSTDMYSEEYFKISIMNKWDMCIVDETHKLLYNDDLYKKILSLSKQVKNILLLSATPILHRENEYHKLLALLNPARFENMQTADFENLLNKQKYIRDIVYDLMKDLPDYLEYDLSQDFSERLSDINNEIKDPQLEKMIIEINSESENYGLNNVKLALAYISEFYQIERGIIRHRRAEIEAAGINRELEYEYSYNMQGMELNVYEENCYNAVMDYLEDYFSRHKNKYDFEKGKGLLEAVFSSPYAVLNYMEENNIGNEEISQYSSLWKKSVDYEIDNIKDIEMDIDNFYSKLAHVIDYIDQEDYEHNKKFLVFTGYTTNVPILVSTMKEFFGDKSVTSFSRGMNGDELQESADQFQNELECRIMICDESGGEGRNFQIADYIIHYDLPWSPAKLEQRIGRLDRIGRDITKPVKSVIFHSNNTLENDLFNIYHQALKIFEKSLCGLEIAFEDLQIMLNNALLNDIRFGISAITDEVKDLISKMDEEVERERYYDMARQLDIDLQEQLQSLINRFTENEGEQLMRTMLAWPRMAGLRNVWVSDLFQDGSQVVSVDTTDLSLKSMENALYYQKRMDDVITRAKMKDNIIGTFSRKAAVNHENLAFFAPYNTFFDGITENAQECYKGRCAAFRITNSKFDWKGILSIWNVHFNPIKLYDNNLPITAISLVAKYLPLEQAYYHRPINPEKFGSVIKEDILDVLEINQDIRPIHLGKRDDGMIDTFKRRFPKDKWKNFVRGTYRIGKKYAQEELLYKINVDKAKQELENMLVTDEVRKMYYGSDDNNTIINSKEIIDALVYGLENPIIELDSMAYIEIVK